jgi:hypothetical protein
MSGSDERTWEEMNKREKLALLLNVESMGATLTDVQRAAIADRVRRWFLTHSMKDPNYCINVVAREAWREHHGDTVDWDKAAAASPGRWVFE